MKKLTVLMMAVVFGLALATSANAGLANLQKVFDDITTAPVAGVSSINVYTDALGYDAYWDITGTAASASTMVIEVAGMASSNSFGVYNGNTMVTLFDGSAVQGDSVLLSIKSNGSVYVNNVDTTKDFSSGIFGYFIKTGNGDVFYSDTSLNADSADHMLAYQGKDKDTIQIPTLDPGLWTSREYALAFEDLTAAQGSDWDYDDMVVMVESVTPVPEPATLLLLGSGLAGLGFFGRRRKNA